MKKNFIYKGDSIKILKAKIQNSSVNTVFADPPYNLSGKNLSNPKNKTGGAFYKVNEDWDTFSLNKYEKFTFEWIEESKRVLKSNGSIFICASLHNLKTILLALELNELEVKNIIIWQKANPMPNQTRRLFTHSHEYLIWAVKGKGWTFNAEQLKKINPDRQKDGSLKMMQDIWKFPVVQGVERLKNKEGRALHPTQKPEALVERAIVASTKKGNLVLDPFMGSGTTAAVCKKLGRNYIGIERDSKYLEAARKRVKKIK